MHSITSSVLISLLFIYLYSNAYLTGRVEGDDPFTKWYMRLLALLFAIPIYFYLHITEVPPLELFYNKTTFNAWWLYYKEGESSLKRDEEFCYSWYQHELKGNDKKWFWSKRKMYQMIKEYNKDIYTKIEKEKNGTQG